MELIRSAWMFFQDQVLGMKWLNALIGKVLTALGLDLDGILGGACNSLFMIPSRFLCCFRY